ncbi:golvesin C-terminal-like domain-containing protein [Gimesia fumaroli]|uniref:Golvesin/Xly CBD-like domain-containing protein n=1 Tax=Gimesia fumaroli TaxID=2527976 RepID=A0A518IE23_9PLAN|nr:hypothetical protein [Gimesia fumaroli]QDV51352.1 hypothetical protein Enr17x_34080 [Gimesia fumaroli]
MLISNWLSSLVSRIRRRPRYNSRARRAIRKRWQAIQQNRLTTVDRLEDRTLLTAQIIDNGDTGFSQTGTWISASGNPTFYQGDYSYVDGVGGTGQNTSSWAFSNLSAGTYRVSGTWVPEPNGGATNMPVTISGIVGGDVSMSVNEQVLEHDLFDDGFYWQDLGYFQQWHNYSNDFR